MPAFLIPVFEWLATQILNYLVPLIESKISQHEQEVAQSNKDDAANAAAVEKLNAAQATSDRISAARDALSGL